MKTTLYSTKQKLAHMIAQSLSTTFLRALITVSGAAFIGVAIAIALAFGIVGAPETASAQTATQTACRTTVMLTKASYGGADIGKEWVFKASAGGGSVNIPKHDLRRGRFEYRDDLVLHRVDSQAPTTPLQIAVTAIEVDKSGDDKGTASRTIGFPACGEATTLTLPVRVKEGGNVAVMTFAFRIETLVQPSSGEVGSTPIDGALNTCPTFLLDYLFTSRKFPKSIPEPGGWVWVDPNHKYRSASGFVTESHVSHTDFSIVHDSHDQNAEFLVDPGQEDVLSDVAYNDSADRRSPDTLEMEWETGTFPSEKSSDPERTFPKWAWPNEGDRVWVDGNWIFDCGHRTATIGESRTEIHSARAIASMRDQVHTLPGTGATPVPVTATDLYIHGRSGFVTDDLECGPEIILGKGTCAVSAYPHRGTPIDANFDFDIHLPPKPSPNAVLATAIESGPGNTVGIAPKLEPTPLNNPTFVHVTVPLGGSGITPDDVYARKIYAGWVYPPEKPLRHFRLTLNKMDLHNDKDTDPGDCECTFFWMNVDRAANEWMRLSSFANGNMNNYDDDHGSGNGEMSFSGASSDFYVRNDQPFSVRANGYDQDCADYEVRWGEPHELDRSQKSAYAKCWTTGTHDNDTFADFIANFGPSGNYGVGNQDVTARGEYDLEFNINELPTTIEDRADLHISKSCTPAVASAGQRVTCTILVDNPGPGLPRNVVVSDRLATDVDPGDYALDTPTFTVTGQQGSPRSCTVSPPSQFTCNLGTVPVGGQARITAAFTSTAEGSFDNVASVSTSSTDPDLTNNAANFRVAVGVDSQFPVPFEASGWRYREVAVGQDVPGFETGPLEPPGFSTGRAAFGSAPIVSSTNIVPQAGGGGCPLDSTVHTHWSTNTDMLLRKTIKLPTTPIGEAVEVDVKIDNDFVAYWNGQEIGRGHNTGVCAGTEPGGRFRLVVPSNLLRWGDTNLLAIRAHDSGGESFVDASASYVIG